MFGSHLSIAGDMTNALREAESLGLDTVQVFTKNQQQWKARPLDPDVVRAWRAEVARLGWEDRVVSHASYLINLASPDDELWEKSVALMLDEIERCETLGIRYLVHHPGSFTSSTLDAGIARIIAAYARLFKATRGYRTVSCLEGTVGSGNTIGGPLEHLADLRRGIIDAAGLPERVGFCLDTCHLHAAGHDLSTAEQAAAVLDRFDRLCGLEALHVFHINDSKGSAGSKLDRHAHIGCGTIGRGPMKNPAVPKGEATPKPVPRATLRKSGFAAIVANPRVRQIPKILETPKEDTASGRPWDLVNVAALRALTGD